MGLCQSGFERDLATIVRNMHQINADRRMSANDTDCIIFTQVFVDRHVPLCRRTKSRYYNDIKKNIIYNLIYIVDEHRVQFDSNTEELFKDLMYELDGADPEEQITIQPSKYLIPKVKRAQECQSHVRFEPIQT